MDIIVRNSLYYGDILKEFVEIRSCFGHFTHFLKLSVFFFISQETRCQIPCPQEAMKNKHPASLCKTLVLVFS